jgi:hypothetical protein
MENEVQAVSNVPEWAIVLLGMAVVFLVIAFFKKGKRDGSKAPERKMPPTKQK